ncbi:MAG: ABC transporter ATP-binding protein [Candidatus Sumerlaeaceae bacterium]|nr:ABC transporter ATP-binding protein [Candidatus Sumerlaeaceae bacterium]
MSVLEISELTKSYPVPGGGEPRRVTVVDVPRFVVSAGEQVALEGPSGSGKTTLLHLIAGIVAPTSGRIVVAGHDMTALGEAARDKVRARHIGYVFQTFNLLQGCTALENVAMGMAFGTGVEAGRARELLERVGLADRADFLPRQLSSGQQQRVAVARALANRPALVLADEPTGNLDRRRAREALALMREVCAESGAALLLVSHDHDILSQFGRVETMAAINRAFATADGNSPVETR